MYADLGRTETDMILWQFIMQTQEDWTPVAGEDRRIGVLIVTCSTTDVVPHKLRRIIRVKYMIGNRFNAQFIGIRLIGLQHLFVKELIPALVVSAPALTGGDIRLMRLASSIAVYW